jgi:hypothetical protein
LELLWWNCFGGIALEIDRPGTALMAAASAC